MTMPEGDKQEKIVRVQVPIDEDLRNQFKSVTAAEGKTMSEVIVEFIEEYVLQKRVKEEH